MRRNLTCIVCPRGCSLEVELEEGKVISVTGQSCKRGVAYAETECTHPTRTLTTTMALEGGGVLAVRTDKPVPKELVFELMKLINATVVTNGLMTFISRPMMTIDIALTAIRLCILEMKTNKPK